jgi:hypothetical protein
MISKEELFTYKALKQQRTLNPLDKRKLESLERRLLEEKGPSGSLEIFVSQLLGK